MNTLREAKSKIKRREELKNKAKFIALGLLIILLAALVAYPVQYAATKKCMQEQNKSYVTIIRDGKKITLEGIDSILIEEE